MSDAFDDPMAQAAACAAAASRRNDNVARVRPVASANQDFWQAPGSVLSGEVESAFAEIGRNEIREGNAYRELATSIADAYRAYEHFMERPIGGSMPITPEYPIWGYGNNMQLAPERPITVGDAAAAVGNVVSILPFGRALSGAAEVSEAATWERIVNRIDDLAADIPEGTQGRITMSVAIAEDSSGIKSVLIGTSEPRGYIRPNVTINDDELVVPGSGHAEENVISYATRHGLRLKYIGATRPMCRSCVTAIERSGAVPVTRFR